MTLLQRIEREIEKQALKTGAMGIESVLVKMALTNAEVEEFNNLELDEHYSGEVDGNELLISWTEEV